MFVVFIVTVEQLFSSVRSHDFIVNNTAEVEQIGSAANCFDGLIC